MINIRFKTLAITAYIYIVLPIIIFFLAWLRLYIGIPMAIILIGGLIALLRRDYMNDTKEIGVPIKHVICIGIIILFWVWISGQGGFFYQTWDNHWRNAIFRDLINYSWPVVYPKTGNSLVYYIMHWIVPALFGKVFGWIGGNIALLLWTYTGIMLSYLLCIFLIKNITPSKMWIIAIIFITWNGLDNVGATIMSAVNEGPFTFGSNEGWLDLVKGANPSYVYAYQFSGNNTLLCWVYNQTVSTWIIILLFLQNRNVRNFAFWGLVMLPYAPIPFVGFLIILLFSSIKYYQKEIREKNYIGIIKETCSIPNVIAACTIFPIFLAYYKCNSMAMIGLYVPFAAYDLKRILILFLFYFLEFGIYMILIHSEYKKDILYYIIFFSLILIPIFRIGSGRDLCMRGTIPALFILMIFVIKYLCKQEKINTKNIIFIVVITLASTSPLFDYALKIKEINEKKQFPIISDDIKTLSDKRVIEKDMKELGHFENFLCENPSGTIFYKYLAK